MSVTYCRIEFESPEWAALVNDGWRTICVNSENMALMVRRKS